MGRVAAQVTDLGQELDLSKLERVTRAMEAALRLADSLDGLKHRRDMEKAIVGRLDGEQVASIFTPSALQSQGVDESNSVEAMLAAAARDWETQKGRRKTLALDGDGLP